jgi:hypothetical protein
MGSLRVFACYWRHRWLGWHWRRRVSCAHVPFNGVSSPKKCHNEFLFDFAGNAERSCELSQERTDSSEQIYVKRAIIVLMLLRSSS